MDIDKSQIKERILSIFEEVRSSAGKSFDPDFIFKGLHHQPKKNWLMELYYFVNEFMLHDKFFRAIENEFCICFAPKYMDDIKSLDELVDRTSYLLVTPKSSRSSVNSQLRTHPLFGVVQIVAIYAISSPFVVIPAKIFGNKWLLLYILPTIIVLLFYRVQREIIKHYLQLKEKLINKNG